MNNGLQIFNNEKFGDVRVVEKDGKPYFVGKDIADALGYSNSSKAVSTHCKQGEKVMLNAPSQNGNVVKTQTTIIPESDVYRLIIKSKLPQAEEFEKWVMEEVLPAIRKHGAYMTPDVIEATLTNPDYLIRLATTLKEEQERRRLAEQNLTYANNVIENIKEINITLEEFESKIKAIINRVAFNQKVLHGNVWRDFYSYVNLKMGTNLKLRRTNAGGNGSVISYVRENERDEVLRIAKCWCVELGIDITDFDRLHIREDRKMSYSQEEIMKLFC